METHLTEEELTPAPKPIMSEIERNRMYQSIGYNNAIIDVMLNLELTEKQLLILHTLKPKP